MTGTKGIVAAGHAGTAEAARQVLAEGGNAFDAALGALSAATVCEPLLTSLGGGGFLLAKPAGAEPTVFDFFVQTPAKALPEGALDFYPIQADYGPQTQEFHIGLGSMAVPGVAAGLFEVHQALGTLPMREIMAPAIVMARAGVEMNPFQADVADILRPILASSAAATALVAGAQSSTRFARPGERVFHPELADTLEALAEEGPRYFYEGPLADRLLRDCGSAGGQLTAQDMAAYRVQRRAPLHVNSHGADFYFNPPPSPAGALVAFALALLEPTGLADSNWGGERHCLALTGAMAAADRLREKFSGAGMETLLAQNLHSDSGLAQWREAALPADIFSRGTTHLSVADEQGNLASLTTSNGEGSGYLIPGSGVMMNNMLGEEDLNPEGFHRWQPGTRLASMMCPTLGELPDGASVALGTGGANRIRSAVLQVLVNLFEFNLPLRDAVRRPRLHLEDEHLSLEAGLDDEALTALLARWPDARQWTEPSVFFGGVHAVERLPDGGFRGAGDHRRGGVVALNE